jgi:glycerol uptake facilitator-like aquaporin
VREAKKDLELGRNGVLSVTSAEAMVGNSFNRLAVGFTVATGILATGKATDGVFNLAVALGASVTGALTWTHPWIYIPASLVVGAKHSRRLPPPVPRRGSPPALLAG